MMQGSVNYLQSETAPSLFRNGKVYIKRDKDGSDTDMVGVNRRSLAVDVHDGRGLSGGDTMTCERNGFELLHTPLDGGVDFFDHEQVVRRYYPQCAELVADATGGRVFAFDHNLRSAAGKRSNTRISGGQTVQGPAKIIHGDYTLTSAPGRLSDLACPPKLNDTYRILLDEGQSLIPEDCVAAGLAEDGRFAIINVWRSIAKEPVQMNPLALCDGRTVEPEDLVTFEIHYHDRIGENYFARPSDQHRFYFFPEMTADEPLLLKQWDSAGALALSKGARADASQEGPCTFSFHTAFDPIVEPEDAPDRLSIEVRCAVVYD